MSNLELVQSAICAMGPEAFARVALPGARTIRNGSAVRVPCPFHNGADPNCEISRYGLKLTAICSSHGCRGDALDVVAAVNGLDAGRDFRRVLELAAGIAGVTLAASGVKDPAAEQAGRAAYAAAQQRAAAATPDPTYPPRDELDDLWHCAVAVPESPDAASYLRGRAIDPDVVAERDLARCIRADYPLPAWARHAGRDWRELGNVLLTRAFDRYGRPRSVRASRIIEAETPKRLPPARYSMRGLVLADHGARKMLADGAVPAWWPADAPYRVIVCEGEPDWLTWATRTNDADDTAPAVLGIWSGSWTTEIAGRVPNGARVIIRTDNDQAGNRYAERVRATIADRCEVLRGGRR